MQRSILGQLLPDAMVSYLENHGAEKFAQIFLGDYDTPEAIWNAEMRRMLIEKIAAHIFLYSYIFTYYFTYLVNIYTFLYYQLFISLCYVNLCKIYIIHAFM